jgi:SAM-dependent methyltransferase
MNFKRSIDTDRDLLTVAQALNPRQPLANDAELLVTVEAITETMIANRRISGDVALNLLVHFLYVIGRPAISQKLARYCRLFTDNDFITQINTLLSAQTITDDDMIRAIYFIKSSGYDDRIWPGATLMPELLATLPLDRTNRALDLGCGTGRAGTMLRQAGFDGRLVGVDLSAHMLKAARESGHYQHLIEANLMDWLDINDESFDLAVVLWVTDHFTLSQARRLTSGVAKALPETGIFLVDRPLVAVEVSRRGDRAFSVRQFETELRRAGFAFGTHDRDGNRFYVCTRISPEALPSWCR